MLEKVIRIAADTHGGQTGKAGKEYILHPSRLMNSCANEAKKICTALNDVIEEMELTSKDNENG